MSPHHDRNSCLYPNKKNQPLPPTKITVSATTETAVSTAIKISLYPNTNDSRYPNRNNIFLCITNGNFNHTRGINKLFEF